MQEEELNYNVSDWDCKSDIINHQKCEISLISAMTLAAIESGGIKNVHVIMCTWFYNSTLRFLSDDRFITQMHILLYFFVFVFYLEKI